MSTNPVVTGVKSTDSLKVNNKPNTINSITGPTSVTANQTGITYSVTSQSGITYAWTVPAGCTITLGQGTATIKVTWGTAPGSITVKGSNSCGTSNTKSLAVSVSAARLAAKISSPQTDELELTNELKLYPNPASSVTYLSFTSDRPGGYSIELTDITGKVLLRKTGKSLRGENKININVSKYENGMYLLKLMDKNHSVKSVMFTKQGL